MSVSPYQLFRATLAYADVFDFPLTREEVVRWGIRGINRIPRSPRGIRDVQGFLVPQSRLAIVALRRKRARFAVPKWAHVRSVVRVFRCIPTVTLVGVTGGLAMDNAGKEDDIDLFFIVLPGTLWISRLLVTLLAEAIGIRRRPRDEVVSDKICLNMFMDAGALGLPHNEQDLFAAHEVLQMVPLWEREGTYRRFLHANAWARWFLPNVWNERYRRANGVHAGSRIHAAAVVLRLVEPVARALQLRYMERRRTSEVIRPGMLRFHPRDARLWVKEKYAKRLKKWDIPLDKIFYHR